MVAADAAVKRTYNSHRAYTKYQTGSNKTLCKCVAGCIVTCKFLLRPVAKMVHLGIDINPGANNTAECHGNNDQQRVLCFDSACDADQDDAESHTCHHSFGDRFLHAAAQKQPQRGADHNGKTVDDGTDHMSGYASCDAESEY